jgi:hypothetical protein
MRTNEAGQKRTLEDHNIHKRVDEILSVATV